MEGILDVLISRLITPMGGHNNNVNEVLHKTIRMVDCLLEW